MNFETSVLSNYDFETGLLSFNESAGALQPRTFRKNQWLTPNHRGKLLVVDKMSSESRGCEDWQLLTFMLKGQGYDTDVSSTLHGACARLSVKDYDAIVIDIDAMAVDAEDVDDAWETLSRAFSRMFYKDVRKKIKLITYGRDFACPPKWVKNYDNVTFAGHWPKGVACDQLRREILKFSLYSGVPTSNFSIKPSLLINT